MAFFKYFFLMLDQQENMRFVAAVCRVHLKIFGACQSKNPRSCSATRMIFTGKKFFSSTPPADATKRIFSC